MKCPHCQNEDNSLIESEGHTKTRRYFLCTVCSKIFIVETVNEVSGMAEQETKVRRTITNR